MSEQPRCRPGGAAHPMRTFDDDHGQRWQAALLEASYGDFVLVFSPLQGGENRQCALHADHLAQAEALLAALDDEALRARLGEASPWDHDAGMARIRPG